MFIADALSFTAVGGAVRCSNEHVKFTFKCALERGTRKAGIGL